MRVSLGLGKGQKEASQPRDWKHTKREILDPGEQFLEVTGSQSGRRSGEDRQGQMQKRTRQRDCQLNSISSTTDSRK